MHHPCVSSGKAPRNSAQSCAPCLADIGDLRYAPSVTRHAALPALCIAVLTACHATPPSVQSPAAVAIPTSSRTAQQPLAQPQIDAFELLPAADDLDPLADLDEPADNVKLIRESVDCGRAKRCLVHYALAPARSQEPMAHARERLERVLARIPIPASTRWGLQPIEDPDGDRGWRSYLLRRGRIVGGSDVIDARVREAEPGASVQITLSQDAAQRLARYTRDRERTRLAILFEDQVESVPVILNEITGPTLQLTFGSSGGRAQAEHVAGVLNAGRRKQPVANSP